MCLCDRLDDGQAEPEPAAFARAVAAGPGEPVEYPVQVGGLDAAARVAYGQDRMPILAAAADLDLVVGCGVRDGVLDQRVERQREAVPVAENVRVGHRAQPPPAGRVTPPL